MQTVNNLFLSVSIFEVLIETTSCNFMFLYELAKSWKREKRFKKITDSRNFPSTKRRPKTNFHQQRTASQKADINQTQEHTAYDEMQTVIKFCLISLTTDLLGLTTDRTFILIIEVIFTLHISQTFSSTTITHSMYWGTVIMIFSYSLFTYEAVPPTMSSHWSCKSLGKNDYNVN